MYKTITFWLLFLTANLGYAQTSIKRIDSLIAVAKKINDVDSSSKILEIINRESKEIGYKDGMASYVLTEAVNLYNRNNFEESLKLTYDGEKTVLSTGDNAKIAHLYALRGNCFNNLFYFDKSQECLLRAKKYAIKITDDNSRYTSLGRIYRIMAANFNKDKRAKNADSVLYYQKKSYNIQSKITNQSNHAGMIIQSAAIGSLFFQAGNIDSAKHYFYNAIAQAKKHNLPKFSVEALLGLGHINVKAQKLDTALNYYLKALPFAQKNENANNIKVTYQSLAKTYELLGNTAKSKDFYKQYALITDSIMLANKAAVTIPGEIIVKERESRLAKENQLRNIYLIFAASISVLSILIVIILYKNISASKKSNAALNAINKQMVDQNEYLHNTLEALEQSNEKNNRVMQIITHDLRSPMAAIVGLSDFMISDHNLSEDDLEVVKLINTSGQDSLKFIGDILQQETEAAVLKKEPIDLQQLLNYCVTQSQYKAKEKDQDIKLQSEPITVEISREKIWRVINNLINNAIKFSPKETTIDVTLSRKGKTAIITVRDNGIGIPNHLKDKIFTPGDEGKRVGTSGEKSFGLGLAISRQIIEEHGGSLAFESEENEGTTFFITLPI